MERWLWWPLHAALLGLLFMFLRMIIMSLHWEQNNGTKRQPQAFLVKVPSSGTFHPPKVVLVGKETRLGREASNDLVLEDPFVSTTHARVYLVGEEYWLEDLGSRNSTYVNGAPVIMPQKLSQAAVITMGNAVVIFHTAPNSLVGKG